MQWTWCFKSCGKGRQAVPAGKEAVLAPGLVGMASVPGSGDQTLTSQICILQYGVLKKFFVCSIFSIYKKYIFLFWDLTGGQGDMVGNFKQTSGMTELYLEECWQQRGILGI